MHNLLLIALFMTLSLLTLEQVHAQAPSKTLRVAGLFDLTGGGMMWGKSEQEAFLLAVSDFEKENRGYKVDYKIEDSMFVNRQAVTAFHKFTAVDKIRFLVGPTWETFVAIMPLCEKKQVVCFSPSYHSREFYSRPWRYNFTAWFDDRQYAITLAEEMNRKSYKHIVVFAAITPYYDSLVNAFLTKSRVKPKTIERMVLEERDFRTLIAKIPNGIDAIFMLLDNLGQIQAFLRQWSELRKEKPDIYSDDLVIYLDPPEDIKRLGFNIFYSYPVFDETLLGDFKQHFSKTYGHAPQAASASVVYDETMILLGCMKQDVEPSKVRDCIAATKDFQGYSGKLSFDGGQTVKGRVIKVKGL